MLDGIRSDSVQMEPNYDGTTEQPVFLGGLFPNVLCNGTQGIATGMASKLAPHYAGDVFKAIKYVLGCIPKQEKPNLDTVIGIVRAPDFPTGGVIANPEAAVQAYRTGHGSIRVRGKYHIESGKNADSIIFTEIPYGVSKKMIVEELANKVYNDESDGLFKKTIADITDRSEKGKIKIVIKLKRGVSPDIVVNNLFKHTKFENTFSINATVLIDGRPVENLNLLQIVECYCKHQLKVKVRTTKFNLSNHQKRLEVVNGFLKAESIIEDVIKTIRGSANHDEVLSNLMSAHGFTEAQAKAIDAKRLGSLNKLDSSSLEEEKAELEGKITFCENLLNNKVALINDLMSDIDAFIARGYFKDDKRLTEIAEYNICNDIDGRDLVQEQDIVVFYTHNSMVKAIKSSDYSTQGRAGKGNGIKLREDDFVEKILYLSNKDDIILITDKGRAYVLPAYKIPIVSKTAVGKYLNNFVAFEENEKIMRVLTIKHDDTSKQMLFVTKRGYAKRLSLEGLTIRKSGIKVITLDEGDSVAAVSLVSDDEHIMSVTHNGLALRTTVSKVSTMGRAARGSILMRFKTEDDYIVSAFPVSDNDNVIFVSEKGLCKRCSTEIVPERLNRGGKGAVFYKPSEATGAIAAVLKADKDETLFIVSSNNTIIRIPVNSIAEYNRGAKGVIAIRLKDGETIKTVAAAPSEETDEESPQETEAEA